MRLLIALQLLALGGSAQGIQFAEGKWADLLAQAKTSGKLIFVDAYAEWCGPCKMMDRKIFTDARVGEYYNANFINAQIDMEKGEGPDLSTRYGVRAYPTFLFVNGEGELVHQGLGYQPVEKFLELGAAAAGGKGMGHMRERYESGDRDPAFLREYLDVLLASMSEDAEAVAHEYLKTQPDWKTPENMELILQVAQSTDSELFRFLAKNRKDFEEAFGSSVVINQLQRVVLNEVMQSRNAMPAPDEMEALYQKAFPDLAPMLTAHFRMNYYQMAGDMPKFAEAAVAFIDGYGDDDAGQLNNVAWTFYESIDDKALLQKALGYAKRSVELEPGYANTDTLAALYYKLGKKKEAQKTAEQAIEMAKASGEDYTGTTELLDKIKAM